MRSSCRVSNIKLVDKVWEIFKDANTKSDNSSNGDSSNVNGVKKDASVPDADNSGNNEDLPQASSETVKDDTDMVKLNKRERKELRREKQSKKSKKEKRAEHDGKGKSGTKRKLDCIEAEEPNMGTDEPKKQKKRKKGDDTSEEMVEIVEVKKKKKKKGSIAQEEALPQSTAVIKNGTIERNGNHDLGNESLVEVQHSGLFKWTTAIKRVLKEAPEEGLKLSKLQRKVFSLYFSAYGEAANTKSKQELAALLSQKLSKKNKFIMYKDRVKLRK